LLRWKDRLAGIIGEGVAAGEFKADTNAEDTAVTMIALLEGAILFTKATGKMSHRKAIVNSLEKIIKAL
jgi:hypothetical protein